MNARRSVAKRCRGMSLVEMLSIVAILGALAAVTVPRVMTSSSSTKSNACFVQKGEIELQVQLYLRNAGAWPATNLSNMIPPGTYTYFPSGLPVCPVDGSAYTIDATTHKVIGHTH